MVEDSLYAVFIINSISTVGLFLISFYEKKYKNNLKENDKDVLVEDIPF